MGRYDDIINLPHHVSKKRARMSMVDRGAQFSPFAALTGYEAVIQESTRLTQSGRELAEGEIAALDEILRELMARIQTRPWAAFTCFQPDARKAGGAYVRVAGNLKRYDAVEHSLVLTDGTRIPLESIVGIEKMEEAP